MKKQEMKSPNLHTTPIEIHTPDVNCDIDSGSDNPTITNEELPTESNTSLSPDFWNSEY